ncbi:MAG: hypothetical protein P1Q69_11050 [Candidatus Thorarchaeota archaeon]|nr:hypothetical protein [Candidatus Thorarchaeota archaeon]
MRFEGYEDFEDALADIQGERIEADKAVLNWQWELLREGTYAMRVAHGLLIFTEIEKEHSHPDMKGFVFWTHYSVACLNGEKGDAHRATFWMLISKEMFCAARETNWYPVTDYVG